MLSQKLRFQSLFCPTVIYYFSFQALTKSFENKGNWNKLKYFFKLKFRNVLRVI